MKRKKSSGVNINAAETFYKDAVYPILFYTKTLEMIMQISTLNIQMPT